MIDRVGKIAGICILLIALFLSLRNGKKIQTTLVNNKFITTGFLEEKLFHNVKANGEIFRFTYVYKGVKYIGLSSSYALPGNVDLTNRIINRCFPVVLDSTNPQNSDILLSERKFKEYEIEYPDSLNWISSYVY